MLPSLADNGARLAAILPTAFTSLALGMGSRDQAARLLHQMTTAPGEQSLSSRFADIPVQLPAVRACVIIVVDGLGYANLRAAAGHARTLAALPCRRIETVIPTTTGAALTSLTTGRLPGAHGLIGYKIRHPDLGLITTLKDWGDIVDTRSWQRSLPLFTHGASIGIPSIAIGRQAHATGGLTEAILAGTEYHAGQTIADRFAIASRLLRAGEPLCIYLYVDELDKIAHRYGWGSRRWMHRLEQLDVSLGDLLRTLPGQVGVVVTADHGMIDVAAEQRIMLTTQLFSANEIAQIGGEPRMRSIYLHDARQSQDLVASVQAKLGKQAWVGTREEAYAAGWFGPMVAEVAARIGDLLVIARGRRAFLLEGDDPRAHEMIGQHGGIGDEERGVPLALAGAFAGTGFVPALTQIAALLAAARQ